MPATTPQPDEAASASARAPVQWAQVATGGGVLLLAALLGWGASAISSDAGYGGVGPDFLPWALCVALGICGVLLIGQALTGGYRHMPTPSGAARGNWHAMAWVSAGVLANAALITTVGFILGCALCFVLAVRGLRISEGKPGGGVMASVRDGMVGMLIAAPTYWLFSKVLKVSLPGLTGTGWL